MSTAAVRVVVTDTNVLMNLMHVCRLSVLARLPGYDFVIPEHVREEITVPEQRATLESAISDGWLSVIALTEPDALILFAGLLDHIGRGEAACITLAATHGWSIASDEKGRFLREAISRVGDGRVITTPTVFVLAIRSGLLSVAEADADKATLAGRRFRMPFASFRELVE